MGVTCTDYDRHERLLDCPHQAGVTVAYRFGDGCSGRLCTGCESQFGARSWPGATERIAGPARGLDALEILRSGVLGERP